MVKVLRSSKGFSLVELMIVVAIIGILASVAIPNFQRFQRKARQAEAKNMLSAYYTSEQAFKAEYNAFAGNFYATGYKPDGLLGYRVQTNVNVTAGIDPWTLMSTAASATAVQKTCVKTDPTVCPGPTGAAPGDWKENPMTNNIGVFPGMAVPAAATALTFNANAAGGLGQTVTDQWTIDQTMTMLNTQSGI